MSVIAWRLVLALSLTLLLSGSCKETYQFEEDTPTSGKITIAVDEAFLPIIRQQVDAFSHYYKRASISTKVLPENEAIAALVKDSVRLVVVSRDLTKSERDYFATKKLHPKTHPLALDAVAIVTSEVSKDSLLTLEELKQLLLAKDKGKLFVFDQSNSSNLGFVKHKLNLNELGGNVFAVNSNQEVVDYVKSHPGTYGFIGGGWVSDYDNKETGALLKGLRVVGLKADSKSANRDEYYYPFQEHLYDKKYPLTREIFAISRETGNQLGSGFIVFVASEIGQRIILKAGLMPVIIPQRNIKIKK